MSRKASIETTKRYYETKVARLIDGQRVFEIETPETYIGTNEKGYVYEFTIFASAGNFSCECVLLRTFVHNDVYLTTVRVISPVVPAKTWTYPRYNLSLPLTYSLIGQGESLMTNPKNIREGRIRDLSGGGVKFICRDDISVDSRLRIVIEKQEGSVLAEGVVAGTRKLDEPEGDYKYEIRTRFIQTGSSNRKKTRVDCSLKCRYTILKENDYPFSDSLQNYFFYDGTVINISESGLRLLGSVGINQGLRLYLEIQSHGSLIRTECEVVSKHFNQINGTYENGLKFLSIKK